MSEPVVLKLVRAEQEVTLVDNEVQKVYVIRELDGPKYKEYMTFVGKRTRFNKDGDAIGFKEFENVSAKLLSLSLFEKDSPTCVPIATIELWPITVQEKLAEISRKLSDLGTGKGADDEDEDEEKND